MNILLTNDDGIRSPGLLAARKALEELGKVMVVSPDREYSCIGKAITAGRVIKVRKTRMADGKLAYAVSGTPADSVLIALNKLLRRKPRLLISGINLGPNLGMDDALDSGTLGAAFEAALRGIPSIAVSYCMVRGEGEELVIDDLSAAAEVTKRLAESVLKNGMPRGVDVLSVNVPKGFRLGSTPVKVTKLSLKPYRDLHVEEDGGYIIKSWTLDVYPDDPGSDVEAVKEGALTITPIKINFPCKLKGLETILRSLQ
ncbi:MAG: 5'/3'-nucleotidase SurE [Thermoprotei archaeon]|nr:MAG: 5'/3'-nucleotidase SurE [Thermoprotei archaeon]